MTFIRRLLPVPLLGALLLLSGCLYDNPPSGPSCGIDTWLLGRWEATDKAGHRYAAVMTPATSDHYRLSFSGPGTPPREFDGWISRVGGFSILVLKSLNEGPSFGKHALYHYELLAPGVPPPGGIGNRRMRLSELQLDESARPLDSYRLRASIRRALKDGSLLVPHDVTAERKGTQTEVPGSIIWTRTGGVTLRGESF